MNEVYTKVRVQSEDLIPGSVYLIKYFPQVRFIEEIRRGKNPTFAIVLCAETHFYYNVSRTETCRDKLMNETLCLYDFFTGITLEDYKRLKSEDMSSNIIGPYPTESLLGILKSNYISIDYLFRSSDGDYLEYPDFDLDSFVEKDNLRLLREQLTSP